MKETIIKINELMGNYRTFKEEVKKNFFWFWEDMTEVFFEVETGMDRVKECGGECFKSFYSAYKYVQEIFNDATNVTAEKYATSCEYGDDYYKYKAEDFDGYEDECDETYCQINIFYGRDGEDATEGDNLCKFEKMDENTILFRNMLS